MTDQEYDKSEWPSDSPDFNLISFLEYMRNNGADSQPMHRLTLSRMSTIIGHQLNIYQRLIAGMSFLMEWGKMAINYTSLG